MPFGVLFAGRVSLSSSPSAMTLIILLVRPSVMSNFGTASPRRAELGVEGSARGSNCVCTCETSHCSHFFAFSFQLQFLSKESKSNKSMLLKNNFLTLWEESTWPYSLTDIKYRKAGWTSVANSLGTLHSPASVHFAKEWKEISMEPGSFGGVASSCSELYRTKQWRWSIVISFPVPPSLLSLLSRARKALLCIYSLVNRIHWPKVSPFLVAIYSEDLESSTTCFMRASKNLIPYSKSDASA